MLIMRIFSWNMRGLNALSKHRILKKKIDQEKEDIVMLQETKCDNNNMKKIAKKTWKQCEVVCIEAKGPSGGLALLWNPNNVKVDLVSQSNRIITILYIKN
jgi:exonuclease III